MAAQGRAQAAAEAARIEELGEELYEASDRGEAAEVARLLTLGAPIELRGFTSVGQTPLFAATNNGHRL